MNPRRHLKNKDIDAIVEIIKSWPRNQKITWPLISEKVYKHLNLNKSGDSLSKYGSIYQEYKSKKNKIPSVSSEVPIDLKVAHDRIEKLKSELESCKATITRYDLMFLTIQNNAYARGLNEEDLFAEMQPVNRK